MPTFTLAISCLTTSNLPWFMDLTFYVPMQYCSLQHRILLPSPVTSTTGWCFCFGSLFILSGVISPFFSSSILGPYQPGECHTFLPFHTLHEVLKARILKWFAIPFSSGPRFVRTIYNDPSVLVVLCGMAHSFIELDSIVVHVIRLVSFLWCCFQSVLWWRIRRLWKLPDGRDFQRGKWVLFWWVGPCSVNL